MITDTFKFSQSKKPHKCDFCFGSIEIGEKAWTWKHPIPPLPSGFRTFYETKYLHEECYRDLVSEFCGMRWSYAPGSGPLPERLKKHDI